jgi:diadenosine tetraphosphatase ApaH/serine/threonine PP2A family protein phosphatase
LRLALFGDIHSNIDALDACLSHAAAIGTDRLVFLGDLVGYGSESCAVVDKIAAAVDAGAIAVQGNHDAAVDGTAGYMNETAQAAIHHARRVLNTAQKAFLSSLPLIIRDDECCFVHASAVTPEKWDYVDSPAAAQQSSSAAGRPYTFSGHVHDQILYFGNDQARMSQFHPTPGIAIPTPKHRRWLAIVGSAGQPRDRNPASAYVILDTAKRTITFHRVAYDHYRAAKRIREAGLPDRLAYRLERGI